MAPIAPIARLSSSPVEAQRSDGFVWRRHWHAENRLVIDFVDLAVVEVHEAAGTIVFDRALAPEMEQHLLFDHVLPLVLASRGNLVLHAGVISRHGKGVVVAGASGAGKSTFTAFVWRNGWTVGNDDGAVIFPTNPPTVEPTYSTVRRAPRASSSSASRPTPCRRSSARCG